MRSPHQKRGDYEVHLAREGFASIRHVTSGEIMHSRTPPMEEARLLYAEPSNLVARLRQREKEALVLWDVGLGAAANALAAIEAYEHAFQSESGRIRRLKIVSFEIDFDPLLLALECMDQFPYLRRDVLTTLLEKRRWAADCPGGLSWELREQSFPQCLQNSDLPRPEVIFYDLYSGKTHPEAWHYDTFARLFSSRSLFGSELFTYTVSTATRAGLLAAGYHVAKGRSIGVKAETTIAVAPEGLNEPWNKERVWLGSEWLGKWRRSSAQYPADLPESQQAAFAARLTKHPQFCDHQ